MTNYHSIGVTEECSPQQSVFDLVVENYFRIPNRNG